MGQFLSKFIVETYIQISKLNDFIFCPKSLFLHTIFEKFSQNNYHSKFQSRGKFSHKEDRICKKICTKLSSKRFVWNILK